MTLALGGPGVACSALRIRRLAAGELAGEERARVEAHLAGCGRCQAVDRELERERQRLAADLPFDALAAGVAERLARPAPRRSWGPAGAAAAALLAAAVLAAVAVPAVRRAVRDDAGDGAGFRLKGGAALTVWVGEAAGPRVLGPGEAVPPRAVLRVGLAPAGRRYAAVALVDAEGVVVLHAGAAGDGPLPGAFEWTGPAEGTLVAVLDDAPIDAAALAARLAGAEPARAARALLGPGAEVLVRPLRREPP